LIFLSATNTDSCVAPKVDERRAFTVNMNNEEWNDHAGDMGDVDEDDVDDVEDETDDVEDDVDNFDEEATKRQQEFQDACGELQRNDPNRTILFTTAVSGYGIPLGNALLGNTHLEELYLCLFPENINSPDDDDWGVENIALILRYLREGAAFRTLCIWGGTLQYTSACVRAIAQNPNTRSLVLNDATEIPLLQVMDLLRTSETLRFLFMPMVNSTSLAESIQANVSLGFLSLRFDPEAWPKPNGVILHHLHSRTTLQGLTISQSSRSIDRCRSTWRCRRS
jgi:hypothetical protein